MKKGTIFSIGLIILGFVFEGLHFATDITFFEVKFWILGVVSMIIGSLGVLYFMILPILNDRAEKLGKIKKKNITKGNN